MPTSLGHVTLLIREYDEAIEYFTKVLGFVVLEDTAVSETKRWVRVAPPSSSVSSASSVSSVPSVPSVPLVGSSAGLLLARAATPEQRARVGDQTGGRVAFFLYTSDFVHAHREMTQRGVRFVETPRNEAYGRVAVFEDLYGNRWDLLEAGPMGEAP